MAKSQEQPKSTPKQTKAQAAEAARQARIESVRKMAQGKWND